MTEKDCLRPQFDHTIWPYTNSVSLVVSFRILYEISWLRRPHYYVSITTYLVVLPFLCLGSLCKDKVTTKTTDDTLKDFLTIQVSNQLVWLKYFPWQKVVVEGRVKTGEWYRVPVFKHIDRLFKCFHLFFCNIITVGKLTDRIFMFSDRSRYKDQQPTIIILWFLLVEGN